MIKYYIVSVPEGIRLVTPNSLDVWLPCSIHGVISFNFDFHFDKDDIVKLDNLFNSCFKHD